MAWAWEPVGPISGSVTCGAASASSPQVMYVVVLRAHAHVLMRSTDRGTDWDPTCESLPFLPRAVMVDPSDASVLYALSPRVLRSTDSGGSWSEMPAPRGIWFGLYADPARPHLLLAAGHGGFGGEDRAALSRSTDQGATWQLTWCDTTAGSDAYSVIVDPVDTNTIYCGGYVRDRVVVYKSTDDGGSWTSHDIGVPDQGAGSDSGCIASHPSEWPGGRCPRCLVVSPSNHNTVLLGTLGAGMYRSSDGGTNWSRVGGASLNTTYAVAVARRAPEVVYAGCEDDVLHSTDGGQTWEDWWSGAYGKRQWCVLVPTDSADVVYCGNEGGFFRGTAPGRYWNLLYLLQFGVVPAVTFAGSKQASAYAAIAGDGLYASSDSGGSWRKCTGFPGAGNVVGIATPVPSRLWAITSGDSTPSRTYSSTDSGNSWGLADTWFKKGGAIAATSQGLVVATGSARDSLGQERCAVATSIDGGGNWRRSLLCLGGEGHSVAVSPLVPGWILAAGESAATQVMYSTRDTGRSWQRRDSGVVGRVNSVLFCPWSGGPLVCGTTQGVYSSADSGRSWSYSGLAQVRAVVADWYARRVYAATRTGVFSSYAASGQWNDFNSGLVNLDVLSLSVSPDSSGYEVPTLAGTNSSGVFRDWLYHVGVFEDPAVVRPALCGLNILPNPFRGRASIELSATGAASARASVYDAAGRRIAALGGRRTHGKWVWDWDARGIPAGTYFVRAVCASSAYVCRVTLLD